MGEDTLRIIYRRIIDIHLVESSFLGGQIGKGRDTTLVCAGTKRNQDLGFLSQEVSQFLVFFISDGPVEQTEINIAIRIVVNVLVLKVGNAGKKAMSKTSSTVNIFSWILRTEISQPPQDEAQYMASFGFPLSVMLYLLDNHVGCFISQNFLSPTQGAESPDFFRHAGYCCGEYGAF